MEFELLQEKMSSIFFTQIECLLI